MKNFKTSKKVLALLLSLSLIFTMMPAMAWNAFAAEAKATDYPIYVLAGGDFQAGDNGQEDHYYSRINMGNILDKIKQTYSAMDGFIFVGDYDGDTHNDANATTGIAAMMEEVSERFTTLNHDNSILLQGNHETANVAGIDPTGGYEFDGYSVYVMNQADYCERQTGKGTQIQGVADDLETWLNTKLGEGYDAPIFVTAHVPLAYGTRTYTNGDGLYAKYVFDVLNRAAENGLNIIFMHGHDHAYGADNYLGGEAIYLQEGDKINIAVPGENANWTEETLKFTYMNAGYVGYYNENYYNVNSYEAEKLTMTVFKIEKNQVTVERYSKDGLYNLKSAGREGFYANGGTCAGIGLEYNTTVYGSPQTISLGEVEDYGTIGEYVAVEGTVTDDVPTSGNDWTTITTPVNGTKTYNYTQATSITAGQEYVIVGNNNAVALMDNNGSMGSQNVNVSGSTMTSTTALTEWTFSGTNTGTIYNGTRYLRYNNSSFSLNRNNSTSFTITDNGSNFRIRSGNYSFYYNGSSWTRSGNNTAQYVRLYQYTDTTTTDESNGLYGRLDGNLTYNATAGMTADEALAGLKGQIDGYYYEAMDTPASSVTGTKVDDSALTWEWVDTYNPTVPGDYAVKVSYAHNGETIQLGIAEVVVPATKTYYIAEGNGMYYVNMNTTEDAALAMVKAGVTVYSATDETGANKQVVGDDTVTWKWVDKYNGADSGPYTVEILKDGTSLGTVEVKVNIKYETGIVEDWTYIGESEATGGSHTYTLDTDGIDAGSSNKYIIVAESQALALHTEGSSAATAMPVNISSDGKTLTTNTRDYEYYWNNTYGFTRGSYGLNQSGYYIYLGEKSASYMDGVINNGDGTYCLYDNEGTKRTLYYGTRDGNTRFLVSEESNYTNVSVRLYKYTGTTGGTEAGPIYAKIEGSTVYSVDQGTSASAALAKVKEGITGYISSDANGSNPTELDDSALTWKWKNTYTSMVTGSYWVEISYNGMVLGTVEVRVKPGAIINYPEYPDEGAVKVSKTATGIDFQSSGIAQVEVSASGVPVKKGADVIVMLDTSSSMNTYKVTGSDKTRLTVLEESMEDLVTQFQTPGDDGELLDIRVAIADFNGFNGYGGTSGTPYDRDENDRLSDQISYAANGNQAKIYTGTGTLAAGAFVNAADLKTDWIGTLNYASGTNYDYAMDAIYQLGTAIKAENTANNEERDLYVIFMSDGAAMQWNYYHSNGSSSNWQYWLTGAWSTSEISSQLDCTDHSYYYAADVDGDGYTNEHRMADAIKGSASKTYQVIRKTSDLGNAVSGYDNLYEVPGLEAKMFAIAFDPTTDQNTPPEAMTESIKTIASEQIGSTQYYYEVTAAEQLATAFGSIGNEIAYAASNARYVDKMGDSFNLQMAPVTYEVVQNGATVEKTITPKIEIITYDIYTRQDFENGTITADKIGDRKGTSSVAETVTFETDSTGKLIAAYSDQIGGGTTNILADGTQDGYVKGVIYAKTFIYNTNVNGVEVTGVNIPTGKKTDNTTTGSTNVLPSETFYWKMGTVQSSELAMRYYVYLDGSMEGTKAAGSYATNEYATLYYDNYLGNPCYKDTVSPTVAWKSANVSYAFYLVNEDGEIIVNQTTGQTGSFANKVAVTKPVVYKEILLNNQEQITSLNVKAISDDVLPKYYELYDENAVYDVTINSNSTGYWEITKGDGLVNSTYVTNYKTDDPSKYSNELINNTVGDDYTHTTVWFAVVWKVEAHPDAVVVDYGLPVDITVLTNDMFGDYGKLDSIGAYKEGLEETVGGATLETGFTTTYTGKYGTAKATPTTGKVRYTLDTMEMNGYDKFAYAVNYIGTENAGYYYDTITVIPATNIYYEDDFLTYTGNGTEWTDEGTVAGDVTQDEDRPGKYSLTDANNIYGYDSVNKGMSTFSMGTAKKVHVDADSYATAEFSFYGTGFDVVGMTSNTTGVITVEVLNENNETVEAKVVNTYYGYTVNDKGEWVPAPDTENALYQVPVIQVENLAYGKYKAIITATYADVFDKTTPEGYDLYLDAIRIYDPANDGAADGTTDTTIENAYMADGEGWPSYIELRNKLIEAESFDDVANSALETPMEGLIFIDGDTEVGDAQIEDYASYGPNNEVYLAPGQRVAFILDTPEAAENVHIGIKGIDGNTGTYTITNIAKTDIQGDKIKAGDWYNSRTFTMDTATEMYYDLTDWKDDIIVISNTGNRYETTGGISLTNIKSTYKTDPNGSETASTFSLARTVSDEAPSETSIYITPAAAALTLKSLNTPEESEAPETPVVPDTPVTPEEPDTPVVPDTPVTPEEPETPPVVDDPEEPVVTPAKIISVKTDKNVYTQGDKVKVTVTTNSAATKVKVGTKTLKTFKVVKGNRTWTTTVNASKLGKLTINAVAYNKKGTATKKVTKTITVKKFAPKILKVNLNKTKVKVGAKYTVTVKAGSTVKHIRVNGKKITKFTTKNGVKTFKVTLKATKVGKQKVKVVAYNKALYPTNPKFKTVTVKKK